MEENTYHPRPRMTLKERIFLRYLPITAVWTVPVLVIAFGVSAYFANEYIKDQKQTIAQLEDRMLELHGKQLQTIASSTNALTLSINVIEEKLSLTKSENLAIANELERALNEEKARISSLSEETEKISGSVGNLEKLSEIDPELLMKYSRVSFLNEHYVPSSLSEIRNKYLYSERETKYFHTNALPFLVDMLEDSLAGGKTLYVKSAYRSFNEQEHVKDFHTKVYGEGANQFSADQGYSEHQLGTTVDLITTGLGGELTEEFDTTDDFTWLEQNAHKYGFTLSYPRGNSYYDYEPWHWRFVGVELATKLYNEGKHFYDLDQRVIDEYLISIFDQS